MSQPFGLCYHSHSLCVSLRACLSVCLYFTTNPSEEECRFSCRTNLSIWQAMIPLFLISFPSSRPPSFLTFILYVPLLTVHRLIHRFMIFPLPIFSHHEQRVWSFRHHRFGQFHCSCLRTYIFMHTSISPRHPSSRFHSPVTIRFNLPPNQSPSHTCRLSLSQCRYLV